MNQKHKDPICFPLLLFKRAFRINQPSMTESFDKPKILRKEFKMFWWSLVQRWLSCWPNHVFYLRPVEFRLTAACTSLVGQGGRCTWRLWHPLSPRGTWPQDSHSPGDSQCRDVLGRQSAECLPSVRAAALGSGIKSSTLQSWASLTPLTDL